MPQPDAYALLALAFAQLGQGQLPQAIETYQKLGTIDALGASFAASGLGDLAAVEGRFSDAVRILEQGAAADLASKSADRAAAKFAALAYAQRLARAEERGDRGRRKGAGQQQGGKIRFLAARTFVDAGELPKAQAQMASLASELQPELQAYAKIIEGEHRAEERGRRAGDQAADRGEPRCSTPGSATSISGAPTWQRPRSRRPMPSSTAASSAAAKRWRCSSTRSRPIGYPAGRSITIRVAFGKD